MLNSILRTMGITLAIVLLAGLAYWQLSGPTSTPPMRRSEENTVRANITGDQRAAQQYLAQAARADSAAKKSYISGQAITRMARQYHRQTYPKHAPLPATPSPAAIDSLQRLLAAY